MKALPFRVLVSTLIIVLSGTPLVAQDQSCRVIGALFGMDLRGRVLLLMSDARDLVSIRFQEATPFLQVPAGGKTQPAPFRIDPAQVNVGDRVCVQLPDSLPLDDHQPIQRALVTRRTDIGVQQRNELARWQTRSAFGLITAIDSKTRTISLEVSKPGQSTEVMVDASGPVGYHSFLAGEFTSLPESGIPVAVGDYIYVRGEPVASGTAITAHSIVTGGFRTFTGTIDSMEVLANQVRIRMLLSGTDRTVDINPSVLYATSPAGPMRMILFADLMPGDPILVLAQSGGDVGDVRAMALISSFSSFGLGDQGDGPLTWAFEQWK